MPSRLFSTAAAYAVLSLGFFPAVRSDGVDAKLFAAPDVGQSHSDWLSRIHQWREDQQERLHLICNKFPESDDCIFEQEALRWTRTSYIQPQSHLYDTKLFNPLTQAWTVDTFLKDLEERYGGIDSVLLWAPYPLLGIDDRNQYDFLRSLPGGLPALRGVVDDFHSRGVRVFLPYLPWDTGTRPERDEEGRQLSSEDALMRILKLLNADGVNGDTMDTIPRSLFDAMQRANMSVAFEPHRIETGLGTQAWTPLSWGYFWSDSVSPDRITQTYRTYPGVNRAKVLDRRGRFLTHVTERFAKERWPLVHLAWLNGDGLNTWENVWTVENEITQRDGELIRRFAIMSRFLGRAGITQDFVGWDPYTPDCVELNRGGDRCRGLSTGGGKDREVPCECDPRGCVHGSRFEGRGGAGVFFSLVNVGERNSIAIIRGPEPGNSTGIECVDVYRGVWLGSGEECESVEVPVEGRGIGGVLFFRSLLNSSYSSSSERRGAFLRFAVAGGPFSSSPPRQAALPPELAGLEELLQRMREEMGKGGLGSFDDTWRIQTQRQLPMYAPEAGSLSSSVTRLLRGEKKEGRGGKVKEIIVIPPTPSFRFRTAGVEIEGGCDKTSKETDPFDICYPCHRPLVSDPLTCGREGGDVMGVGFQFFWEKSGGPRRYHDQVLELPAFEIDKHLVTNSDWQEFVDATEYVPADSFNYLKHLNQSSGESSTFTEEKPVVWISYAEAQMFCKWRGGRLPHAYEWQLAAEGAKRYAYPWGDDWELSRVPLRSSEREVDVGSALPIVGAFSPGSDSGFGVSDLSGFVWEMTDAFEGSNSRTVLLKGGSMYRPEGARWYVPPVAGNRLHNKMVLMSASFERSGFVGFRCVRETTGLEKFQFQQWRRAERKEIPLGISSTDVKPEFFDEEAGVMGRKLEESLRKEKAEEGGKEAQDIGEASHLGGYGARAVHEEIHSVHS